VLGVAALIGVWLGRPLACNPLGRKLDRDLAAVRQMLLRSEGDAEEAFQLLQGVMEHIDQFPRRAGEAHFLFGTASVRLAERAGAGQAGPHWQAARRHLEEAEQRGVPDRDRGRLQYRLAKAYLNTNEDPQRVADLLAVSVEMADNQTEGYGLLSQAYLRLPQPDYKGALAANEKLRQVPLLAPEVLAPAQLQAGEILIKLQRQEDARKQLEKIGSRAPIALQARARILRARSYQEENHWIEAADLWRKALGDPRDPLLDANLVRYHLGVCLRHMDQDAEAAQVWQECLQNKEGEAVPAAALALADLQLQKGQLERTLELMTLALQTVHKPEDWTCTLIDRTMACDLFEKALQAMRKAGRFEMAVQLIEQYKQLAAAGRIPRVRAETLADWAQARRDQTKQEKEADKQKAGEEAARDLFRQAGDAFIEAVGQTQDEVFQADLLWLACRCRREGKDKAGLIANLNQLLPITKKPEIQGEGWYLLGEALRLDKNKVEAENAYKKCIQIQTPFAYRARYRLAMAAQEHGDLDGAEAALQQNLHLLRFANDPEAKEQSLFALGGLYYKREKWGEVVRHLEEALAQFPANPEATRARFHLAESYRRLAILELDASKELKSPESKEHSQREYQRWLQKAADEYLDLARFLEKPESKGHLLDEERIQIPFIAAECLFNLGQYGDALQVYDHLAEVNAGQPQCLQAMGGCVRCLAAQGLGDKVRQRLDQIRGLLINVEGPERQRWEEWLTTVSKPIMPNP